MNSKVIDISFRFKPADPVQLDLFDTDRLLAGKYSFIPVASYTQDELFHHIKILRCRLIIDLRIFPSFDRPKYNHSEVLEKFIACGTLYFPAVYLKYTNALYKQLSRHRNDLKDKSQQGHVLMFYDDTQDNSQKLQKWRSLLERNIHGAKELHPRAINRLEALFGDL
jgi:hypothetical protein